MDDSGGRGFESVSGQTDQVETSKVTTLDPYLHLFQPTTSTIVVTMSQISSFISFSSCVLLLQVFLQLIKTLTTKLMFTFKILH